MRLIQVGIGGRGRHWLDFIAQRPEVETVACVDLDQKALDGARDQLGCRVFSSMENALTETNADAAIIASPSHLHGEHARQILSAGLAVMVEKPLADGLCEAVDVVHAARAAGRPLMVAENYRFFRAERTLRKFLDDDRLGRIESVVCIDRRDQPSNTQGPWVKKMAQPFLTEIAVHHFDSFRYLFNRQPFSVWARTYNPKGSDYDQNAAAETLLEMENGLRIQYSGSFIGSRYEYSLSICGEHGEVRTDRNRVWWRPRGQSSFKQVEHVAMPNGESLRYPHAGMLSMLAQFKDAVSLGTEPETGGADNLWTLAMFEAAVRSTESGNYISIEDIFTPQFQERAGVSTSPRAT